MHSFSAILLLLFCQHLSASHLTELGKILQPANVVSRHSVEFVRVSDRKILASFDPSSSLVPASVSKLLTTATVIAKFGSNHHFKTKFYYTGSKIKGEISGDLIVVGDGDPFIVSELLWQLAADFRNMGIKKVRGNILIDQSLFAGHGRDESRKEGSQSSSHAYDAPVSAFGVNFNTVAMSVAADEGGKVAIAGIDPYPIRGVNLINKVKIGSGRLNVDRQTLRNGQIEIILSGSIGSDEVLQKIYRSIASADELPGEILRSFLEGEGIIVLGRVMQGEKPSNAKILYELESYDMAKIITGLNKFSNNYIADVLVKRLGASFPLSGTANSKGQGSYRNGLAVISDFMVRDVGANNDFVLINGSGLSSENRISAKHLTDLLVYLSRRMDVFPEFLASLPAAGWDGTLAKRFDGNKGDQLQGKVRAKTGTLTSPVSVSALSGYVQHPRHGLVAFAIIQNGLSGKSQPPIDTLRRSQENALHYFVKNF